MIAWGGREGGVQLNVNMNIIRMSSLQTGFFIACLVCFRPYSNLQELVIEDSNPHMFAGVLYDSHTLVTI